MRAVPRRAAFMENSINEKVSAQPGSSVVMGA